MSEMEKTGRSLPKSLKGKFAFAIILSSLYGFYIGIFLYSWSLFDACMIGILFGFIIPLTGITVLVLLIKHSSKTGKILFALFIVFFLFTIISPAIHNARKGAFVSICMQNMQQLGVAMYLYTDENNGYLPTPERWCDLIQEQVGQVQVIGNSFLCPATGVKREKKCSYAMNPNVEPNSPPDVILLFESNIGWNQYGGHELLDYERHDGRFVVLLKDYSVRVMKLKEIWDMNWGEKKNEP